MFLKIIRILLIAFIIILCIGVAYPFLLVGMFRGLAGYNLTKLNKDLPVDYINYNLIRALSGALGLGTYFTIKNLFSFGTRKREIGVWTLGASFVTYPLLCYFIINASGYKRCADNLQGGYEYVDAGLKIDPKYGTKVCNCTPEMRLSIEGKSSPNIIRMQISSNTRFFTYDGQPLIWYYQYEDGRLEFFGQAGVHPQYGVSLKPVTKDLVEKVLDYINTDKSYMIVSNKGNDQNNSSMSNLPETKPGSNNKENSRLLKDHSSNYISYINNPGANKSEISIVIIDEKGVVSNSVSNEIAKIYSQSGKKTTIGLIKSKFIKTSDFKRLFDGNSDMIKKLKLDQYTNYLGLGKISYSFRNGSLVDGTVICNASINMNIISANNKSLLQSFTIQNAIGNGSTESQAQEEALKRLVNIYATEHTSL
jgi:hypothetical protein